MPDRSFLEILDELSPNEGGTKPQQAVSGGVPALSSGQGDERIKRYLAEAASTSGSLLSLVRQDTGEQGSDRGGRVDFESDPISGHRQSFSVYLNEDGSETWACYSASNASDYKGGTLLEYLLATNRASDKREAVRYLLDATGHQPREKSENVSDHDEQKKADTLLLPPWEHVHADNPPKLAPSLIDGVLRRGHVGTLIAKAKSGKSWAGIALCVAVATGTTWLGFDCAQGSCCYIDPELDQRSLDKRFSAVSRAMGQSPEVVRERVVRWGLRGVTVRGKAPTIEDVAHDLAILREQGRLPEFALVVVDSCSALLSGDENAASDVRAFFNVFLRITEITSASLLAVHHEGKAMSGDREAMGRSRGSAAWDDCPDVVLSLVQTFPTSGSAGDYLQEGERAYMLECAAVREFGAFDPKRLIWGWPCFRIDSEGITDGWKPMSGQRKGGKQTGEKQQDKSLDRQRRCTIHLLAYMVNKGIGAEGIPANEACEVLSEAMGESIKSTTLKRYIEDSDVLQVWQRSRQRWSVVPAVVPEWDRQTDLDL